MASIILNNIPFNEDDMNDDVRNLALGRFMTAWSQVEIIWGFIFQKFLDLDYGVASVVFDSISSKDQIEIINGLVGFLKTHEERRLVSDAISKVKLISQSRNRIVHSSWGMFNGEAARFYSGITPSELRDFQEGSQKGMSVRKTKIFTVTDIVKITEETALLRKNLEDILTFINPEPGPAGRAFAEQMARVEEMRRMAAEISKAMQK